MAEDVINGLENMRLMTEEEEVITILDEGRKEEIEGCALSLIGKFLTCKPFNKLAAHNTLRRAWGLEKDIQIVEVGSNLFQFKFSREFDLDRVLRGGPWSFDNQVLLFRRWHNDRGAPFDMSSPKVASEIGRRLGEVVEVEKRRSLESQNLFMRVKVALPLSKPLRRGGFIGGSDGQRSWVDYRYERLPLFCHYYGLLGHDLKHYVEYFACCRNGEEVAC
ncbi:uncharacterized protein LOC115986060 [Quercus lobata]|uniref:uncharacterized protein LOC115986060 n=1 Tax=Quercus lobata TaxID=97700 RepID=UPI001245B474|nr:uncharacterized protein LOC115986060 [Quercus lobata]